MHWIQVLGYLQWCTTQCTSLGDNTLILHPHFVYFAKHIAKRTISPILMSTTSTELCFMIALDNIQGFTCLNLGCLKPRTWYSQCCRWCQNLTASMTSEVFNWLCAHVGHIAITKHIHRYKHQLGGVSWRQRLKLQFYECKHLFFRAKVSFLMAFVCPKKAILACDHFFTRNPSRFAHGCGWSELHGFARTPGRVGQLSMGSIGHIPNRV